MLTPVIVAAVILRVIGLVNSPDLMIILTHGGPGLATYVLSLLAFNDAYTGFNFGAAAAVATVMLVLLMVFTSAYVRVSGVTREYDVIRSRRQTQRLYDVLAYAVLIGAFSSRCSPSCGRC